MPFYIWFCFIFMKYAKNIFRTILVIYLRCPLEIKHYKKNEICETGFWCEVFLAFFYKWFISWLNLSNKNIARTYENELSKYKNSFLYKFIC